MAAASTRPRSTRRHCSARAATPPCRPIASRWALLLARHRQPGAGVFDPDPLAATLELRGGVERGRAQIHSLRRQRDLQRRLDHLSEPILDPDAGPAFDRRLAFVRNLASTVAIRQRWRGCLRASGIPLVFIGAAGSDRDRHVRDDRRGDLHFRPGDEGKPVVVTYTTQNRPASRRT